MRLFHELPAITLSQLEGIPSSYPAPPSGISAAAAALSADMVWQRLESYIAYRWTSRSIVWIVDGNGEWQPPLTGGDEPATITLVENWNDGNFWETTTPALDPSPLGGYQLRDGTFRFTGTVGGGTVPEVVKQAWRLLAEYMAQDVDVAGASSFRLNIGGGALETEYQRNQSWAARAMANSGAGDLLRNYRMVK
jgi:hypothetical protein